MKTLLLMRHSYAASNNPAWSDKERPLTDHGRELCRKTAEHLKDLNVQRIIFSSATRTTETAELVAAAFPQTPTMNKSDDLYLAQPGVYRAAADNAALADEDVVLIVGHNPGIASLIGNMANESLAIFPGCVAIFSLKGNDWSPHTWDDQPPLLTGFISEGERRR